MEHLRFATFALLLLTACSGQKDSTSGNELQRSTIDNHAPERVVGPMRVSSEQVQQLTEKANRGDVGAMHSLAAHHITAGEKVESRHWLARAVKHGDCHAVRVLINNRYYGASTEEISLWQQEEKKLGCDPNENYMEDITNHAQ